MSEGYQNTLEQERATQFTQQLHNVLYHPLTVETIDTFAEDALEGLITLNEAVVNAYTRDFPESDQYDGRVLEDKAYQSYGLENLNDILDRIEAVRTNITRIKVTLPQHVKETSAVITPPDAPERTMNGTGAGTCESPQLVNRVLTLAYILEHDFDIPLAETDYLAGSTTDSMMRQEPYVRVSIPNLSRVVYVCDEEGNASYVFDSEILDQLGVVLPELDSMSKNQRNALIRVSPTVGRRIIQSPEWRTVIANMLETPFNGQEAPQESKRIPPTSEFQKRERAPKLDFNIFINEVRTAYTKDESTGNTQAWYQSVYKNHPGWPANPHKMYKDDGWVSYPEMVGNETIEHLTFDSFQIDVKESFIKDKVTGGIHDWYLRTYTSKPGWPAAPNIYYKDKGWTNWESLVGREKIEFLTFEEFVTEVREAYKTANYPQQIQEWYREEQIKHPKWPARPDVAYKDKGWTTLRELVEKDIRYSDFTTETKAQYIEAGSPTNIFEWYMNEYKNHLGWPSKPHRTYKDKGWVSWPAMVGIETIEYLQFDKFKREVKDAYLKAGSPENIQSWYRTEYSKHPGWPAGPHKFYANKGWAGFTDLVDKEDIKLPFDKFILEVKALSSKETAVIENIKEWYDLHRVDSPTWPAAPNIHYKDSGWQSWTALVGKEKQSFVTCTELHREAKRIYAESANGEGITEWYANEYKKHQDWPSNPQVVYLDQGWVSWNHLVGKEVIVKLSLNDFLTEVRNQYRNNGSPGHIAQWYRITHKQHPSWPAAPEVFYRDDGWVSYPAMVGHK